MISDKFQELNGKPSNDAKCLDMGERLETTEGNVVHYAYIEKFIEQLGERFYIKEIAYDRWGLFII